MSNQTLPSNVNQFRKSYLFQQFSEKMFLQRPPIVPSTHNLWPFQVKCTVLWCMHNLLSISDLISSSFFQVASAVSEKKNIEKLQNSAWNRYVQVPWDTAKFRCVTTLLKIFNLFCIVLIHGKVLGFLLCRRGTSFLLPLINVWKATSQTQKSQKRCQKWEQSAALSVPVKVNETQMHPSRIFRAGIKPGRRVCAVILHQMYKMHPKHRRKDKQKLIARIRYWWERNLTVNQDEKRIDSNGGLDVFVL